MYMCHCGHFYMLDALQCKKTTKQNKQTTTTAKERKKQRNKQRNKETKRQKENRHKVRLFKT